MSGKTTTQPTNPVAEFKTDWRYFGMLALLLPAALVSLALLPVFSGKPKPESSPARNADSNVSNYQDSSSAISQSYSSNKSGELADLSGLSIHTGDFPWRAALHDLLRDAQTQTLSELMTQANEISGLRRRSEAQETIVRRMVQLDPKLALSAVQDVANSRRDPLLITLFQEWSLEDLDRAVNHAQSLDESSKRLALRGILLARDDLNHDSRREIARKLSNEMIVFDVEAQSRVHEAITNPEKIWNELVSDQQPDISQISELVQVANAWVDLRGFPALAEIGESLQSWETASTVLSAVLFRIARTDPRTAFEQALNLEFDRPNYILLLVMREWTDLDWFAALEAVDSIESQVVRDDLYNSIIRDRAATDPRGLLENLSHLPENYQVFGQELAITHLAKQEPEAAVGLLESIQSEESRNVAVIHIASNWADIDPHAALDWMLTSPWVQNEKHAVYRMVLEGLAVVDPELALKTALDQPLDSVSVGHESVVVESVASYDVERARNMLRSVREGPHKASAFSAVGSAMIRQGSVDEALNLASSLAENARISYFHNVLSEWSQDDPIELLESLDALDSQEVRSIGAFYLVTSNPQQRALTDDQIERAKKFLNAEHKQMIEH